jgi:hypothetical protein
MKSHTFSRELKEKTSEDAVFANSALRVVYAQRLKEVQEDQWHLQWIDKNRQRQQKTQVAVAAGHSA